MAKKAKKETEDKPKENILVKSLQKKYGDVVMSSEQVLSRHSQVIPFSPKLNIGLSGGIPEGSWVIMSGPAKCGKSTSSLDFAATAQKEEYGGRHVYYLDVEGRLKKMNLEGIAGLNQDQFSVISSTEGHILSAEEYLNIASEIIKSEPGCVLIIDSASALCSSKELSEDISGQTRALGPKILAAFCRQLGGVVPIQRCIVIMMQHLIANTSGWGPTQYEDGGRKAQYQVDVKLRCKGSQKWEDSEKQIGQTVNWEVMTSALGPPGQKVQSYIRYGTGIDHVWETVDVACDLGLIDKSGAWFNLDYLEAEGLDSVKVQGQQKVWTHLSENKEHFDLLTKNIREMI